MSNLSRRALVTSAAALPALALPAIAARAEPDPIFAAIEAYRKAFAEHGAAIHEVGLHQDSHGFKPCPELEELERREGIACDFSASVTRDLASTVPTTLAGAIAMLRFAEEFDGDDNRALGVYYDDDHDDRDCRDVFMVSLRKGLERLAVKVQS
jgi:hypothetical protein